MSLFNEVDFYNNLRSGNSRELDQLFNQYYHWLVITAHSFLRNKSEAEEVVQEFFIDFWENKRYEQLTMNTAKALKNHLFICIKNRCLNRISRNNTRKKRYESMLLPNDYVLSEHPLENIELKNRLDTAIGQLTNRQREVFELGYMYDKTRKDIAKELGIAEETVKKLMAQALKALRTNLNKSRNI